MSDVNLNFVVSNNDISFTVQPNDITFTPTPVDLTFYASGAAFPPAGGAGNTQVQYNDNGVFAGSSNFIFNKTSNTVTMANANVNILSANNFASTGGNISLGSVTNLHITGGTNGYVLQTDGVGNLGWTAMTGGGGNGAPGGANTQVQFNNGGLFGGVTGFTYNTANSTLTAPYYYGNGAALYSLSGGSVVGAVYEAFHANAADVANSVAGSNVVGAVASATTAVTVTASSQPNIQSLGTLLNLGISGNLTVGANCITNQLYANNANLGASVNAGYFIGDGSLLTNLSVTGGSYIANGTSNIAIATANGNATISINGTSNVVVISNSNAAFTSNISTTKNVTVTGNVAVTGNISGAYISGNGSNLTNITGANVTGTVANATLSANSTYALQANNSTYATYISFGAPSAYQPNINRIGTTTYSTYLNNTAQTLSGSVYNFNLILGEVQRYGTPLTGNIQVNFRGNATTTFANSVANNSSFTGTLMLDNGFGNAYTITDILVDGVSYNTYWGNWTGSATSGPQNLVPPSTQGCRTIYEIIIQKGSSNVSNYTVDISAKYYKIYSV